MDYETAVESFVSRQEAIDELARHGIVADCDIDNGELFDLANEETIAAPNADGEYCGGDILAWLGY